MTRARALALAAGLATLVGGPLAARPDAAATHEERLRESERLAASQPRHAEELADAVLVEALARDDRYTAARAVNRRGVARYYAGDYQHAYADYGESLRLAEALADAELSANALNNIGVLHYLWGSLDRAIDYYQQALELRDPDRDPAGVARSLNNLGAVADAAERHSEAIEYFRRATEIYETLGEREFSISSRNNLALSLIRTGRLGEARTELDRSQADAVAIGDKSGEATAEDHRGLLLRGAGRHLDARGAFERALELRRQIGDRPGTATVLEHLGAVAADLGDHETAVAQLDAAIALAIELDVPQLERDAWLRRAEVEQQRGRPAAALEAFRRYHEVYAKLVSDASSRRLAEMRALLEVAKQSAEIERLSQERATQRSVSIGLAAGAGLLAILLALLWRHTRLVQRTRREIESKNTALEQAHAELERSSQAEVAHLARVVTLGELTAAVAHELNQPLAAIQTNAEVTAALVRRGSVDAGEIEAAVDDIALGAKRAWEVLDHLRQLARRGEVERERVDLAQVAADAVEIAAAEARLRATAIELAVETRDSVVLGDRVHLLQVILNLVQNAIAAGTSHEPPRHVCVRVGARDGRAHVAVDDDGPAVAREVVSRLFEPFYTTRPEGLGMGLAISRRLVEAHGGRIWARPNSHPAKAGLVVAFELPLAATPDPPAGPETPRTL